MIRRLKEFLIIGFMLCVSACIQAPPPKPTLIIQCPPMVHYSNEFDSGFAQNLLDLSKSKHRYPYLEAYLSDSEGLRDAVVQCQQHALQLNPELNTQKKDQKK